MDLPADDATANLLRAGDKLDADHVEQLQLRGRTRGRLVLNGGQEINRKVGEDKLYSLFECCKITAGGSCRRSMLIRQQASGDEDGDGGTTYPTTRTWLRCKDVETLARSSGDAPLIPGGQGQKQAFRGWRRAEVACL